MSGKRNLRVLSKRIFIISNVVVTICFLLACLNSFLHPQNFIVLPLLGLAFPILLLLEIVFVLFWAGFRSQWIFLPVITILLGITQIMHFVAWHPFNGFNEQKDPGKLRILSWNISWFDGQTKEDHMPPQRKKIFEFLTKYNPDVICFQEFIQNTWEWQKDFMHNIEPLKKMGYKYYYFPPDNVYTKEDKFITGSSVFSKYPLVDSLNWSFESDNGKKYFEKFIAADIKIGEDTIRFYNMHLQSFLFKAKDYQNIEIIKNADDELLDASFSLFRKIKTAYLSRADQAQEVEKRVQESPYKTIVCGDFNDVPNSYAYSTIRGDFSDAFLDKGFGIGRTFRKISPSLRIDYIFTDPLFSTEQCRIFNLPYSDHNPVLADVSITK
jgi:endonuclease/exonuclease/phosphatase family metal-dependent hydrolase